MKASLKPFKAPQNSVLNSVLYAHTFQGIPERLRLEGTSGGRLAQPSAEAGLSRAGCPGPCPVSSLRSPGRKNGHSLSSSTIFAYQCLKAL